MRHFVNKVFIDARTTAGAWAVIGEVACRRITRELEAIGFTCHTRGDWPDIKLFTRLPTGPDWDWLRE